MAEAFAAQRLDEFTELIAYHYQEAIKPLNRSTGNAEELKIEMASILHEGMRPLVNRLRLT